MDNQTFTLFAVLSLIIVTIVLTPGCHGRAARDDRTGEHGDHEDEVVSVAKHLLELMNEEAEDAHDSRYVTHGLSQSQRDQVIEIHNRLRKGEHASDMHKLTYNPNLERLAQAWADTCAWGHRHPGSFDPAAYGFTTVGENIWAWSDDSKSIPKDPIQDWFNEKNNYDYDTAFCRKEPCGHYTAVTWGSTTDVGCGLAKCAPLANANMAKANYFVCNYGPGGNDMGKKPYQKGQSCSSCSTGKFFCTDNLCDATCTSSGSGGKCECQANCAHGSRTADCKCQCNAGYSGVSCNEVCQDKNPMCGVNGGWPSMFCNKNFFNGVMYNQVTSECPKMCEKCKANKRKGEESELLESLKERMLIEKK